MRQAIMGKLGAGYTGAGASGRSGAARVRGRHALEQPSRYYPPQPPKHGVFGRLIRLVALLSIAAGSFYVIASVAAPYVQRVFP